MGRLLTHALRNLVVSLLTYLPASPLLPKNRQYIKAVVYTNGAYAVASKDGRVWQTKDAEGREITSHL